MTYMPSNGGNVHQGRACLQRGLVAYRPHGISQQARQRRGNRVWRRSDLVWSADGVYRKEESGREKFSCGIGGMPAMWPMWDHVNVLSPAFWPPPFAATARGVRDLRVSVPYPPMADPGTIPHPRRARPGAPGRRGAGARPPPPPGRRRYTRPPRRPHASPGR